jgi:Site-specific recombinase XerD
MLHFPDKLTTYVMRHSWATLMLEAGKSVEIISQCMGHTSIRTTQIYLSSISTTKVDREVNDMLNRFIRLVRREKINIRKAFIHQQFHKSLSL